MTDFRFPFGIGADGATMTVDSDTHIRDLIEQVLFTRRGERVNRPDFGAGVGELLFSENAPELAAAAQHMVQASLQQWLGSVIDLVSVETSSADSALTILVRYRSRADGTAGSASFTRTA